MRKFFKGLQAGLIAAAGVAITQPNIVAAVVPQAHQGQVLGALTIAAAVLPSVAPRSVRKWWGGGQGGVQPQDQSQPATGDSK